MLTRPYRLINENLRASSRTFGLGADARQDRADDAQTGISPRLRLPSRHPLRTDPGLNADQLCLLAAGLFVLFQGGTAEQALLQLSWRFGHIRQAKTGILEAFFLRYQRDGEGRKPFLDWVLEDYDEDALRRDFHANGLASFINDWVLAHE